MKIYVAGKITGLDRNEVEMRLMSAMPSICWTTGGKVLVQEKSCNTLQTGERKSYTKTQTQSKNHFQSYM